MASSYEELLNKTISLYTQSLSSNALGEEVETLNYSTSGVKCRLVPISAEQKDRLPGEFEDVKYTGYFLSTQSLSTDDQIKYNNDMYKIREIYDDSSGYVRKVLMSKL